MANKKEAYLCVPISWLESHATSLDLWLKNDGSINHPIRHHYAGRWKMINLLLANHGSTTITSGELEHVRKLSRAEQKTGKRKSNVEAPDKTVKRRFSFFNGKK